VSISAMGRRRDARGRDQQVAAPAFARAGFAHALVMLDRGGWHRSKGFVVPDNIEFELNPVERIGSIYAATGSPTRFPSLTDIIDASKMAWNRFPKDHSLVHSLCAVASLRRRLGCGSTCSVGDARLFAA
jgi:hypothetical protein